MNEEDLTPFLRRGWNEEDLTPFLYRAGSDNALVSVDILLDSLDPRGRDFERVCKWVLENAPEYRPKVRRVWLWDEWPGRWGPDAGIDLVAEDRDGGLWAVQAKHYDPAYAIKKADLDSFLSESSRAGFTYRLLIATTDHVGLTDSTADARRAGEAGGDAPALSIGRNGGRVALVSRRRSSSDARAETAPPAPAPSNRRVREGTPNGRARSTCHGLWNR